MEGYDRRPRVTIGVPVFNGAAYLATCLDSVLSQTYRDFEVIIVDNASTDDTLEIARKFADRDPRISVHRNETNIGPSPNFNRAFALARGEYFKWLAHDDLIPPELLERFVAALDRRPDAVLCSSEATLIDEHGNEIEHARSPLTRLDDPDPVERFADIVHTRSQCFPILGLFRSDALRRTPGIGSYVASDRNLLAELSLHGPFVILPERLTLWRSHPGQSVKLTWHERARRYHAQGRFVFPWWKIAREFSASASRAPIRLGQRLRCHGHVARWMARHWRYLRGDLRFALQDLITGAWRQR